MSAALRVLGLGIALAGVAAAVVCGWLFVTDADYAEMAIAYAHHPNHAVFQAEYWAAAVRHWGLGAAASAGLLGGLVAGGLLVGVGEVLRRLPR